mgnify:CR=1 FL=1
MAKRLRPQPVTTDENAEIHRLAASRKKPIGWSSECESLLPSMKTQCSLQRQEGS